jgi:hypothetical protein
MVGINTRFKLNEKSKAIPVTGSGDPYGCETSWLPHFLDNRFTKGGEDVSFTFRPPFTPQENFWYSFPLEVESTPGPYGTVGRIRTTENSYDLIGN